MGHGIDISARRLDDLDKEILRFALDYKAGDKVAVDLGCGYGRVSIILALAGFEVWLFDKRDLSEHFKQVAKALGVEDKLKFFRKDIAEITESDLPRKFSIAVAQRVLHHLPFKKTRKLMQTVASKLGREGRVFASFSGLHSEIGKNYPHSQNVVQNAAPQRFSKLSEENQEKFEMTEPVCLYEEKDVQKLFADTNLIKERLYKSSFGNVKVIYYKQRNYKYKKSLWNIFQS